MKNVLPYLFWIVCGVLLLVELVVMLVVSPELPQAPGLTVEDSKKQADRAFNRDLKDDLVKRASATSGRSGSMVPDEPISPEDPEEVEKLLEEYLIHADWEGDFQRVVDNYERQLAGLKEDLSARSRPLDAPLSGSSEPDVWYESYRTFTSDLLKRAIDAGLVVPADDLVIDRSVLEEDAKLREVLGVITKAQPYPTAPYHPTLTARFRISEAVVDALVPATALPEPNPNLASDEPGKPWVEAPREPVRARIASFKWASDWRVGGDTNLVGDATVHRFTLELVGPPAALSAAVAALDSVSTPVLVRLGAQWGRVELSPGELQDEPTAPMRLITTIAVVDFDFTGPEATP